MLGARLAALAASTIWGYPLEARGNVTTICDRRPRPRSIGLAAALLLGTLPVAAAPPAQQPKLASPAALTRCVEVSGPELCLQALHAYVKARPDQAFEAGRVATKTFAHWAAIPFFEQALSARADAARCKDDRLALAVTSGLGQPNDDESAQIVAAATHVVRERCWKELRGPVTQAIERDARGTLTRNVCHVFIEKSFVEKTEVPRACWPEAQLATRPAGAPAWEQLDPKKIQVEPSASVYGGADGRRITLAKVKGKPYYLIKFQGFRGPWNNQVVLHRQDAAGSGHDYWTLVGGRRHVSVITRTPRGPAALWEVHPFGTQGAFRVSLDPAASKATKAQALLAELSR
jgi:hypothetical protein